MAAIVTGASAPAKPSPSRLRRAALWLLTALAAVYLAIMALVYLRQEALIFHVSPLAADHRFTLPDVVETKVAVPGAVLSALHFRLPNPKGVVFFLHGNGGNLQTWLTGTEFYRRNNYDLFMLDYRGYGKSTGRIESEEQLHADVRAAWEQIAPQYQGKKRVIYGRSLGTGLATRLATSVPADLTVLVSPYSSLAAMGEMRYPWLPQWINRYPMRTDLWLPQVKSPVLITHGSLDEVIPHAQGLKLKAILPALDFLTIPDAGHNDIHKFPAYLDGLSDRLQKL